MKKKKRTNGHLIQVELEQLKQVVPLLVEQEDLLLQLEAKSVEDFEKNINELTGFTNAMVSANAFGKEAEYKRLLELETQINRRLSIEDLTSEMELKSSVIANIKEMNTTYYSDAEMKAKTVLEKVMKDFNTLSHTERNQIGFNHSAELIYSPFSYLRF